MTRYRVTPYKIKSSLKFLLGCYQEGLSDQNPNLSYMINVRGLATHPPLVFDKSSSLTTSV